MKICAVICELNPFHNGHEYIFNQAGQKSESDAVLALMSGNFVQRAMPAVIDEYARARCALGGGADIVIELPVVYATASAEMFARGAINILNTIDAVKCLAMGIESDNPRLLCKLAEIQATESDAFKKVMREALDTGRSYPQALTEATAAEAMKSGYDKRESGECMAKPNNILAIAYKKALIQSESAIEFLPIQRAGEERTAELSGRFSSASAIRKRLGEKIVGETMPSLAYGVLTSSLQNHAVNDDKFDALMLFALRTADLNEISRTPDCAEGMEYKIKKTAEDSVSYAEFLENMNTARFTRGRIARICLQTLLGISKTMQNCGYTAARLLGVRKEQLDLLGELPKNIITNKKSETNIPTAMAACYEAEKKAAGIYSIISHGRGNGFYQNLLTV